jgi:hypothetical protein
MVSLGRAVFWWETARFIFESYAVRSEGFRQNPPLI